MTNSYSKTYFTTGKKMIERIGYLRFFPEPVIKWYFEKHQPRLEEAMRNYSYFISEPHMFHILEVGTGQGKFLEYCGKKNVIGIDIWKEGIRKFRAKGYDVRYHDASKRFPFKNASFDVVYAEQIIEHVYDGVSFVKELNRVLRKGGKVIIRTVDFLRIKGAFYGDYTHIHPYTPESLYRIIEDNGFDVIEISHGITPAQFLMRRVANFAVLLPKPIQNIFFYRICRHFSHELFVIAIKR